MRCYETMIAYHPEAGETGLKEALDRAKQVIGTTGGEVTQVLDWGLRDLCYRIAKQRRGHYYVVEFKGTGATVAELERTLRISDRVLRYITTQVDPNRPPLEAPRSRRDMMDDEGGEGAGRRSADSDDMRDIESPEA